ncbi:phosphatidylserine decarboxylase proenzyme 1 [Carex littledalei]|uniref:Phosphatidylserine decarboxylase proenzyme 1, mitochondrial n=1 Tax=Carex littledalei TaxID=544730 RepID=A0A833VX76_9POAL|nr:phosphatidylserine decarboxylase proenzyme 1 [Carex littledalei]
MDFRVPSRCPLLPCDHRHVRRVLFSGDLLRETSLFLSRPLHSPPPSFHFASTSGGAGGGAGSGNKFLVPGATVATMLMLGILHARRLYDDKKVEDRKEKGIEPEFSPDVKASFMKLLPLRSMSRFWGHLMEMQIPVFLRPTVYKAWARAFHSDLEEAALPLENYASLQEFFVRKLKEGSRPIDTDPNCLVSPVDGKILQIGEIRGPGALIDQVKGFSYSVSSLLGTNSNLHINDLEEEKSEEDLSGVVDVPGAKSWWCVSLASPKRQNPMSMRPKRGIFYCVIYLKPGDYHRVHSPVDWNILRRRHFSGRLFPQNERAVQTIRNLYIENERVVLEGEWKEGFIALAAIGATNIGSIRLFIEPEIQTNKPTAKLVPSERPDERMYEPGGTGVVVKKGEEVAAFYMGSTVVLVFQAPVSEMRNGQAISNFEFSVRNGDKVKVGEAIGRWHKS